MPVSYKRKWNGPIGSSKRMRPTYGVSGLARTAIPWAVAAGQKLYGYYSGTKNTTTSGTGVTSQYDRKTVYRRKQMPRRKKVRWVKFVKRVRSALLKEIGTKTVLRNSQMTFTDLTNGQGMFSVTMYGKDGVDTSSSVGNADLKDIIANDADLALPTDRAKFASGILDLTFTNNSSNQDTVYQNTTVELDVYEIIWTKKVDANRATNVYYTAAANTNAINGAGSSLSITDRGATPFEFPDASALGAKIVKKTKYILSQGQVATYQMRIPKNYNFRRDFIDDSDDNFAIPWVTRTLLFIVKGVPTGDATRVLKSVQIGATRKYSYKVVKGSSDADQLL